MKYSPTGAAEGTDSGDDAGYDYSKTDANQIINKPETSIFNLITVRYMKTAFPILFKEEATRE